MNQSRTSSTRRRRRRSERASSELPPLGQLGEPLKFQNSLDRFLLSCVDFGFAALILCMPFVMGGREAPGQLVLVVLACWLSACWGLLQVRQRDSRWTLSLAEPLMFGGIALVILQVVRLPAEQLNRLSPKVAELLPAWHGTGALPRWDRISFMPMETLDSLIILIAYVLIFIVALQRIRTQNDVFRLLSALGIATVLMAAFGLLQYATSNGRFFWFYENPYTDTDRVVKGAFTNRNHFANFMALGIGPLLWCLTAASVRSRANKGKTGFEAGQSFGLGVIVVSISVVIFACLLSLSRGGSISLGIACFVCSFALYRSGVLSGQVAFGAVCVMLLTCGLIAVYGEEQIQKRLDQIASADVEQLDNKDGRRMIWAANVEGIRDFQLVGTGIGTHRDLYPIYMEDAGADYRKVFTHAENGYLQVCLEAGGIGLALLLCAFLLALFWTTRGLLRRDSPLITAAQSAALASILASLAHSGSDFVWYVPACVVPVILLSASACRLRQLQNEERTARPALSFPLPRLSWTLATVGTLVLAVWMVPAKSRRMEAEHHWYEFLRISFSNQSSIFHKTNPNAALRNRLIALSRAIKADPTMVRPQTRMAGLCLKAFNGLQMQTDLQMSLGMLRNAALTQNWKDRAEMDEWINRVFAERKQYLDLALKHSQRAIELCPLEGKAYLYIADLDFIDSEREWNAPELVQQALTVRPNHPQVLFVAGLQELYYDREPKAMEMWKRTFEFSRSHQTQILGAMAQIRTAPYLIDYFEPDVEALAFLASRFYQLRRGRDLQYTTIKFADACFEQAENPDVPRDRSIRYLLAARKACDVIRDGERAQKCFVKASEIAPREFRTHYQYGVWLANRQQFAGAAAEFTKCSEIRPGDDHVRRLSTVMRRKDLDVQLQRDNPRMARQPAFRQYQ